MKKTLLCIASALSILLCSTLSVNAATNNLPYMNANAYCLEDDGDTYSWDYEVGNAAYYGACVLLRVQCSVYNFPSSDGTLTVNYYLSCNESGATYSILYKFDDGAWFNIPVVGNKQGTVEIYVRDADEVTIRAQVERFGSDSVMMSGIVEYEYKENVSEEVEVSNNILELLQNFIGSFWSSFLNGIESSFDTLMSKFQFLKDFANSFWTFFDYSLMDIFDRLWPSGGLTSDDIGQGVSDYVETEDDFLNTGMAYIEDFDFEDYSMDSYGKGFIGGLTFVVGLMESLYMLSPEYSAIFNVTCTMLIAVIALGFKRFWK